jgi:hypothetical protein
MTEDSEWFEWEESLWRDLRKIRPKLRLLADQHVPQPFVEELRSAKIDVKTASELNVSRLDDSDLLQYAKTTGRVLLTFDSDFWSDRKHPPEQGGGVILVTTPTDDLQRSLEAFGLLYVSFAKSFGGDWSEKGLRAKARPDRFFIKMISYNGRRTLYEMKLDRGRLYARQIYPADHCQG